MGGQGWDNEKSVLSGLERRLGDGFFCRVRSKDGAAERSLETPRSPGKARNETGMNEGADPASHLRPCLFAA